MPITYYNVERCNGKVWEPIYLGLTSRAEAREAAQSYVNSFSREAGHPLACRIVECTVLREYVTTEPSYGRL